MTVYTTKSNARRAAKKAGHDVIEIVEKDGGFTFIAATAETDTSPDATKTIATEPESSKTILLSTENGDLGMFPKKGIRKTAAIQAKAVETDVHARDPLSDKVLFTAKYKAPKVKASKDSMTDKCVELASRPEGVTAAELNALTNWKGAPWKWLFSNPKGTGWCDRRDLPFTTLKVEREGSNRKVTAYKVG